MIKILTFFLEFPFRFRVRLPPETIVKEDCRAVFDVETEEEDAVVRWFSNDVEIHPEHNR